MATAGISGAPIVYSFPILKPTELVSCLKDMDIGVTSDELANPTAAMLRPVYDRFLYLLCAYNPADHAVAHFDGIECLSFPELYDEALTEFAFVNTTLRLCRSAGVTDMSIRDIVEPTTKSTRRILSALINFVRFREDKVDFYSAATARLSDMTIEKDEAERRLNESKLLLSTTQQQHDLDLPIVSTIKQEIETLKTILKELHKNLETLTESNEKRKNDGNLLKQKTLLQKSILNDITNERERLSLQIVHSPAKIKKNLIDITSAIELSKQDELVLTRNSKFLNQQLSNISILLERLNKRCDELVYLSTEIQQIETMVLSEKQHVTSIEKALENLETVTTNEKELQSQEQQQRQRLLSLQQTFELKQNQISSMQEMIRLELDRIEIEKKEEILNQENIYKKIDYLKSLILDGNSDLERVCNLLRTRIEEVTLSVSNWQSRLLGQMACVSVSVSVGVTGGNTLTSSAPNTPRTPKTPQTPAHYRAELEDEHVTI